MTPAAFGSVPPPEFPEHVVDAWPVYRLVLEGGFASGLAEIADRWTVADVLDANEVLDAAAAAAAWRRSARAGNMGGP